MAKVTITPDGRSYLLTYSEAAAMLSTPVRKVSTAAIRKMVAEGTLDLRSLGYRTKIITRRSVEKFINEGPLLSHYRRK